jgi:hypothetical protein
MRSTISRLVRHHATRRAFVLGTPSSSQEDPYGVRHAVSFLPEMAAELGANQIYRFRLLHLRTNGRLVICEGTDSSGEPTVRAARPGELNLEDS